MSTITSPRPPSSSAASLATATPPTSRRPSFDINNPTTTNTNSTTRRSSQPQGQQQQKRNRTALRDYYGLKASGTDDGSGISVSSQQQQAAQDGSEIQDSELDQEGFDPGDFVKGVLRDEGLEGVLKVEGRLVNEIRALDGERKALVYDNYSKLIAATETIRKMRTNMDPLGPATSTLSPAIAHIAERAAALATLPSRSNTMQSPRSGLTSKQPSDVQHDDAAGAAREKQRQTVRWVLSAPRRMRILIAEGRRDEAMTEWKEVVRLLDLWNGVDGVEKVREEGEEALKLRSKSRS